MTAHGVGNRNELRSVSRECKTRQEPPDPVRRTRRREPFRRDVEVHDLPCRRPKDSEPTDDVGIPTVRVENGGPPAVQLGSEAPGGRQKSHEPIVSTIVGDHVGRRLLQDRLAAPQKYQLRIEIFPSLGLSNQVQNNFLTTAEHKAGYKEDGFH